LREWHRHSGHVVLRLRRSAAITFLEKELRLATATTPGEIAEDWINMSFEETVPFDAARPVAATARTQDNFFLDDLFRKP
jgi:hypothetical protein